MADKPKLTRAERKQIEAVIRKYRGDGKPHTAQDTIPYQIMYPDGICYLGNRRYSQSIEFFDINYLLAQPDDQTAIFEYLCDLYNYLDSSIHVQFTYPNRKSDREQHARSFEMPPCNDGLDPIRQEQTDILKRQLARGNNGSVKTKYITYTIEADNLKAARARLSRISLDIQGYFKIMGAVSRVLDGKERLEVLHGIMHPDGERFNFDWKWLAAGGLSTKDFIAPSSFAFKNSRMFQMGGKLCAASFLQIITPELTDRILTDFLDPDTDRYRTDDRFIMLIRFIDKLRIPARCIRNTFQRIPFRIGKRIIVFPGYPHTAGIQKSQILGLGSCIIPKKILGKTGRDSYTFIYIFKTVTIGNTTVRTVNRHSRQTQTPVSEITVLILKHGILP